MHFVEALLYCSIGSVDKCVSPMTLRLSNLGFTQCDVLNAAAIPQTFMNRATAMEFPVAGISIVNVIPFTPHSNKQRTMELVSIEGRKKVK